MNVLHQMVPMVLAIEFVLVFAAIVAAMVFPDPQLSNPTRKPSRHATGRFMAGANE